MSAVFLSFLPFFELDTGPMVFSVLLQRTARWGKMDHILDHILDHKPDHKFICPNRNIPPCFDFASRFLNRVLNRPSIPVRLFFLGGRGGEAFDGDSGCSHHSPLDAGSFFLSASILPHASYGSIFSVSRTLFPSSPVRGREPTSALEVLSWGRAFKSYCSP